MKDNVLVSIIVPIYNTQNYLERCLDSIINQTYKNIQIILIDNGSTDNSKSICKEYANKDERIEYYYKENGGLSSAKNYGLTKVRGKYLTFVDSDDFVNENMIFDMTNIIEDNDADLIICEHINFTDKEYDDVLNNKSKNKNKNKNYYITTQEDALRECFKCREINVASWGKLYKKEIYDDIKFPKGLEMEDWAVIVDIMIKCKKVILLQFPYYFYYQRAGSIVNKSFKESDLKLETIFLRNYELIKKHFPKLSMQGRCNIIGNSFYIIDKIYRFDEEKKYKDVIDNEIKKIKKEWKFFLFKSSFKIERKIAFIFLLVNEKWYKKIILLKYKNNIK